MAARARAEETEARWAKLRFEYFEGFSLHPATAEVTAAAMPMPMPLAAPPMPTSPMITVGSPTTITPPCSVGSPIRAAIKPPIKTVGDPIAIMSGGPTQTA